MFWILFIYAFAVLGLIGFIMVLSFVLGNRHKGKGTDVPFESGILPTGSARLRFSPDFYLIAMFFVIFDLEAVFIIIWASSFRELGWVGYINILIFIGILVIVLIYEWRIGALDFGIDGKDILKEYKKIKSKKTTERELAAK
jgi:NADH-quinone oxidoreductase subunit A